jgi:hypothetical protein
MQQQQRHVEMVNEAQPKAFGDVFDYDTAMRRNWSMWIPAGFAMARLPTVAAYRDAPVAAWAAASLVAIMSEDCGPCVQLGVRMVAPKAAYV